VADKLSKEQITSKFRAGEIDAEEMMRLMKEVDRKPPQFSVAEKSGWLSIYFDGLRFPTSLPYEAAVDLFTDENVKRAREYLAANKSRFKTREDRKKK